VGCLLPRPYFTLCEITMPRQRGRTGLLAPRAKPVNKEEEEPQWLQSHNIQKEPRNCAQRS
jgi:hypothetical protein